MVYETKSNAKNVKPQQLRLRTTISIHHLVYVVFKQNFHHVQLWGFRVTFHFLLRLRLRSFILHTQNTAITLLANTVCWFYFSSFL